MNHVYMNRAVVLIELARHVLQDAFRDEAGANFPEEADIDLRNAREELLGQLHKLQSAKPRITKVIHYRVKAGECLSEIAQRFGSTVDLICQANPGYDANPDLVRAWDQIWIPTVFEIRNFKG